MVMIRLLIFMLKFTFRDVANFCQLLLCNINLKNDIFRTCFRQSAKGKMIAWGTSGNVICFFQNMNFSIGLVTKILHVHPLSVFSVSSQLDLPLESYISILLLCTLCMVNSFYWGCVSCMYSISNIFDEYRKYPIYFTVPEKVAPVFL